MTQKITEEDVNGAISRISCTKMGRKTTVCMLTLTNGFEIVATSSCVDPEAYDQTIGERLALQRAKDKVWELLGFALQYKVTPE